MVDEDNLSLLSIESLATKCAEETQHVFQKLTQDTRYCFELFRRAIAEGNQVAWQAIHEQYGPQVNRWVKRAIDRLFDGILSSDFQEDFVSEVFLRFLRSYTTEKLAQAREIKSILAYMKTCAVTTVLDARRKMKHEQLSKTANEDADAEEKEVVETLPGPEARLQENETLQILRSRLKTEQEFIVMYAWIYLTLSPREVYAQYPGKFRDIDEVYQCKANVLARLKRDNDLRNFLRGMPEK